MADYQGKKVVIIGLGMTGLSCVDFFMARGVTPRVMDTRVAPAGLDKLPEAVERYDGGLNEDWPVSYTHPEPTRLLHTSRKPSYA